MKKYWILLLVVTLASLAYFVYNELHKNQQKNPPATAKQDLRPKGMVSINFDDSNKSAYQIALPILEQAGLKATFYIITHKIGKKGYMTAKQILDLSAKGQEIGAHTQSHPYLTKLGSQHQMGEIRGSRTDLLNLGIRQVDTFAYPYGLHNPDLEKIVADAGFSGARTTISGSNNSGSDRYALSSIDVKSSFSFDTLRQAIDEAVNNGQWLILTFHRFDEATQDDGENVRSEILQQAVSYLKNNNITVVTNSQGLQLLYK